MQNRNPEAHQHDEITLAQYMVLQNTHAEMHTVEAILKMQEMMTGPSLESAINGMMLDHALNQVHEELEHHAPEIDGQLAAINADLVSKKADVDSNKVEAKNLTKETFASKQGLFSQAIVNRRSEVEAMLNASAEKSAPNSDTEEVSSLESVSLTASPVTPRM